MFLGYVYKQKKSHSLPFYMLNVIENALDLDSEIASLLLLRPAVLHSCSNLGVQAPLLHKVGTFEELESFIDETVYLLARYSCLIRPREYDLHNGRADGQNSLPLSPVEGNDAEQTLQEG